jgi:hypothetical protein
LDNLACRSKKNVVKHVNPHKMHMYRVNGF